jgi:hypothetical protein
VLAAAVRVDAATVAERVEAQAVEDTNPGFTHLVIQARLPTTTTVQNVQLNADTFTVAAGVRWVEAELTLTTSIVTVREVWVHFPTAARRRNQREQDNPQLLWKCQREAGITASMWMPIGTTTAVLTALNEWFFSCRKSMRGVRMTRASVETRGACSSERDPCKKFFRPRSSSAELFKIRLIERERRASASWPKRRPRPSAPSG